MNLKEKFNQQNDVPKNVVPLGNDEIKSILKTQSEAVFQDKNLTNNSNFIKKSLIDIALDFKSKEAFQKVTDEKKVIYFKKIIQPSAKETQDHNAYLKKDLKKNFF